MTDLFISEIRLKKDIIQNYGEYPFSLSIVKKLDSVPIRERVTFFVGENGSGKSTLLEAIAVNFGLNPEGGSRNFHFKTADTHSELHEYLQLIKGRRPRDAYFLRAESYYNVASDIDRMDAAPSFDPELKSLYGGKSLHEQSHGESFLALVQNRFFGNGLYLLDEPEAALSPARQMALLAEINRLVQRGGSQFIICTHSPILMAYPGAALYHLSENGIVPIKYKETEHYIITRQFLNNPEGMLRHLFEEDNNDAEK